MVSLHFSDFSEDGHAGERLDPFQAVWSPLVASTQSVLLPEQPKVTHRRTAVNSFAVSGEFAIFM
jgi:hypothetical protein